jgi:catechol 2,3-dioxygenase-like lactoylglutathione lyase family enzyme
MGIRRLDHVGIILDDLEAATAFFVALGLEADPPMTVDGEWVGRVIGLTGARPEAVMVHTPDGRGRLELIRFESPADDLGPDRAPANRLGIRHVALVVDDLDAAVATVRSLGYDLVGDVVDYEDTFRLCYVRGPEGIIVELAEELRGRDG